MTTRQRAEQIVTADHVGLADAVPAACFPVAATLASSWDPALLEGVGAALGREARAEDVALLLGPGPNIKRHPRGGRNFEHFSEDPVLAGTLAAAMVRGIQSEGVGAHPKHFPANNQETGRMVIDTIVDERTLRELYLRGFELALRWQEVRDDGTTPPDLDALLTALRAAHDGVAYAPGYEAATGTTMPALLDAYLGGYRFNDIWGSRRATRSGTDCPTRPSPGGRWRSRGRVPT